MTRRRKSREAALQALYQWDVLKQDPRKGLVALREHFLKHSEEDPFVERLIQGVLDHQLEIDPLIERYSEHWRLERMAPIDRTLLRMALFELLYCQDIPPKVTLNEAVDLGKEYGTEESGPFINGLLDRILNEVVNRPTRQEKIEA